MIARLKWLSLIAVTALTALALGCGGNHGDANATRAGNTPSNSPAPVEEIKFERVAFENLPKRDPPYLWPSNGAKVACENFWVVWKTSEFATARLIGTRDLRAWHVLGDSTSATHWMCVNIASFRNEMSFCVEYEESGQKYRSAPREVKSAAGIRFEKREIDVLVERGETRANIGVIGDLQGLGPDDFTFALLPDELFPYGIPQRESESKGHVELVIDGRQVPGRGCVFFWEIHDPRTDTRDRIKINVLVK